MKRDLLLIMLILSVFASRMTFAQADTTLHPKEKRKKGWVPSPLPVIGYDADQGLQLGALCQLFDYGDGSIYPNYRHTIYAEVSFFTKGSAVFELFYDSKYLIPGNIRFTGDITYLPERALDFYGFNGYQANYDHSFETQGGSDYISRVYYRCQRRLFRVLADFQGPILGQKLRWLAGINFFDIRMSTVDISKINAGKKESNQLPDTALLWDNYVKYGLLNPAEAEGGSLTFLKMGLVYDTRDNEQAPNKGIWSEIVLMAAPSFLGNSPYAFVKLSVTHRQFFSLVKKYLVLAYRLNYQGTIGGTSPYYIDPYMFSSWSLSTKVDGLGGARTIRGIIRDRVVGDGTVLGNLEVRWKFWRTHFLKQNICFGLVGFLDGGMVVQERKVYSNLVPANLQSTYFNSSADRMHFAAGLGLRITQNESFTLTIDYGFPFNTQDGSSGLYVGIGHMF
ncbi:MAG: BamA/TamA family outer membrane protein [Bacteroidetes bacterium]|nr:BamA/TamA family outer membrane protein [Bacteroidota bacterium]